MPIGWLIPLLVLLPNALMVRFPPRDKPQDAPDAPRPLIRLLEVLERLGQVGVFVIPCFYRVRVQGVVAVVSLVVMALALGCYYAGWLRYVRQGCRYALLFAPMWGIPLSLAVSPVVYFAAAAALLRSWPLAMATLALAIGHIAVSERERRKTVNVTL
ncbi:MAG TPA: hypothetical protein PKZ84_08255 [Anaerolineae bacterium]|nr:hypothetical protein [Anaerolineae bacterium]HQI84282.1 hypothetical protein [Anaerolineae bacterium]